MKSDGEDVPRRRQRWRAPKGVVLAPLAAIARPWALRPPATRAKAEAVRHVVGPFLAARPREFRRTLANGLTFEGTTDDLLSLRVHLFGVWEPTLTAFIEHRLRPGDVFVDVGANHGWFSLVAAPLVGPNGKVVAIEPSPVIAAQLRRRVATNGLDNLRVVEEAVAEAERTVTVVHGPAEHTGLTRIASERGGGPTVTARPLADILDDGEVVAARMVKIDVEGSEFDVVLGMRPLLDRLRRDAEVVIEVGPERVGPRQTEALFEIMAGSGFRPYELPNDYSAMGYLKPQRPECLRAMDRPPAVETDVVFARTDARELPFVP
ncbi:MAG: FkbM family methyltransferase [Acidimicrobiales bacterium]